MNSNIIDAGDLRKYRTEIPNIIDDMDLSVYAFRLYVHIKRVAGANGGQCFQSVRTMAEVCHMGKSSVDRAKKELVEAGLIQITPGNREKEESDTIVIVDIWRKNFEAFVPEEPVPTGDTLSLPGTPLSPTEDTRSNPSKNIPSVPAALNTPSHSLVAQFRSLVDELKTSTNKSGVLRNIYILCFGEETAPTYSYLGGTAKKIGGAGYLAQRLWELSARPPVGDVLAYLVAEHKGKQQHRKYDKQADKVDLFKLLEGVDS